MTHGQGHAPKPIPLDEAVAIARKHRKQLLGGVELLKQLPPLASDEAYTELQKGMDAVAPDVSSVAWGHKYFSLIFPDKLDDYHMAHYQRFHLVRLIQSNIPPVDAGRFITAGRYMTLAAELEMPINHLTTILNERTERPYRFWRVLANYRGVDGQDMQLWPSFVRDGVFAVGWAKVGDLSDLNYDKPSKDALRMRLTEQYSADAGGQWSGELVYAVTVSRPGDLVLAMDGDTVMGVGRIVGEYRHDPESMAPHQKRVEWLSDGPWTLPKPEGKGSIFREIKAVSWVCQRR